MVSSLSAATTEKLGPRTIDEPTLTAWGTRVGAEIAPPAWIALHGPLGAGKSVLARSICRGAGVAGHIPSPSFTLVQQYDTPRSFRIHHVDLFRLRPGDDLAPLGWEELIASPGLVLVEWAERAGERLPGARWDVTLDYADSAARRVVRVEQRRGAAALIGW